MSACETLIARRAMFEGYDNFFIITDMMPMMAGVRMHDFILPHKVECGSEGRR